MERSIALVGLMGSGKSAVGRRAAEMLGLPFQDTDLLIEQATGCTVAEIFASDGEDAFRARERQLARRLGSMPRTLFALGGGMFVGEENVTRIREAAHTVWLRATSETLLRRLGGDPGVVRPLLECADPLARLESLLVEREPWYRRAAVTVIVDGLDIETVASRITTLARGAGWCA